MCSGRTIGVPNINSVCIDPMCLFYFACKICLGSIKSRVGDDGAVILQHRPSDLYLTDRKETMTILQKDTHTPLHIFK